MMISSNNKYLSIFTFFCMTVLSSHMMISYADLKIDEKQSKQLGFKEYAKKARGLSEEQKKLFLQLQALHEKGPSPKLAELLKSIEKPMLDAQNLLMRPQTDGDTIAAETEVIERVLAATQQACKSCKNQSIAKMMQQLAQSLKKGMGKGNGKAGGGNDSPYDSNVQSGNHKGGNFNGNDTRDRQGVSGKVLESVPIEFRDALEAYFKKIETIKKQ